MTFGAITEAEMVAMAGDQVRLLSERGDPWNGSDWDALQVARATLALLDAKAELCTELARYLPVIERAEADPELWAQLTDGLGIATANGLRAVLAKYKGNE